MKYFLLAISFLCVQSVIGQSKLPVIKATSQKASINDGGNFEKNSWTLEPQTKLDVFTADRTRETKWVTFYTDIDSIRVKVKPGTKFNFVVLLNGKDSCYTQIASAIPPENKLKSSSVKADTIPFTLTAYNAIKIVAVINNTDTLNLHFDVSSFDFHLTRDAVLKKTKLLANQPDALAGKVKPNFRNLSKVFKLQMGNLVFNNPEILTSNITAHEMDGRIGFNVFEGKQVEINYDSNLLIVHSKMPSQLKGYVKSKMEFTHSFAFVKGSFEIANKIYTGNFSMDTGSEQALILDSGWVAKQGFPTNLKLIKSLIIHDPTGAKYEIRSVLSPLFRINGFDLANVPTLLLSGKNPMGFEINYLGNDLLKRFNMILDFKNDYLYLKPNKLTNVKYRENS
jgi:hypothetical protein